MANEIFFKVEIIAEARVDHHYPCVPWCTVCYPCERCGILHPLEMHNGELQPKISATIPIGTFTMNGDGPR